VMSREVPPWARVPLAAWLWTIGELLRTVLFTGMPWELLGHTQFQQLTLVQVADLGGVMAVSFVMAAASVAAADAVVLLVRRRPWRTVVERVGFAVVLLVATLAYGAVRLHGIDTEAPGATHAIAVVQGNLPNEFRWKREFFERAILTYGRLS